MKNVVFVFEQVLIYKKSLGGSGMLEEEMNRVGSENIGNLLCLGGDFQVCGIRVFFFFCTKTICACVIIVWIL